MPQENEVLCHWGESAPYWEKHQETIRKMFAPVTLALIEDAKIGRGHTVLDVATGPGEPALSIAGLVGAEGKVVGIDAAAEMVEAARREAKRGELSNASFEVALADHLSFPANTFDAIVSRFGIMFFPSPIAAIREMLRVLKPGGRMAIAVWHFAERNPFHHIFIQALERYAASPPAAPDAPDALRFAQPGKLLAILLQAGATAASERLLRFSIRASISVEEFWTLRAEMSESIRARLARLPNNQKVELKREVIEALRAYSENHGMNLPAEVLILSGAKWPS